MPKVIALGVVQRASKNGVVELAPKTVFDSDGDELDRLLAGRYVELVPEEAKAEDTTEASGEESPVDDAASAAAKPTKKQSR